LVVKDPNQGILTKKKACNQIDKGQHKDPNQGILTKKKACNQIDKGQQYTVCWMKLQAHLESAHLFDPDAAG